MRGASVVQHACRGLQDALKNTFLWQAAMSRSWASTSSPQNPIPQDPEPKDEYDHATGLEKAELEGFARGEDIFHEDWITKGVAGTPEDPVVVESAFEERVVGVPDPEDDCLVIWDLIKANEPPKQIIEGGEYFVLKTVEPPQWTAIPESFKGGSHH